MLKGLSGTHLKLPQGIVTLLLARSLLGAQGDELIDALCHSSVSEQKIWGAFVFKNQQQFLQGYFAGLLEYNEFTV